MLATFHSLLISFLSLTLSMVTHNYSGGFRTARLPGQAAHAVRAVGLWVEKNPVPPPNRQALDWSVVFTVGGQYSGKQ